MRLDKMRNILFVALAMLCLFAVGCSAPDAAREEMPAINSSDMEQTPISTPAEPVAVHSDQSTANANILIPADIKMEVMSGEERNVKFNYVLPKTGNQNIDNSLMMFCNVKLMEAVGTAQKDGNPVELYLNLDVYEHNGGGAFVYTGELRHGNRETEEILFINHYNMSSGKEFSLMDVFPVEQASALQSAIAQKFAAQYPSADPAKIADTVMPIFALSQNFIQTDSGLVYLCLANEIDPTASWIAQAFLTNDELDALQNAQPQTSNQDNLLMPSADTSTITTPAPGLTSSDIPNLVIENVSETVITYITDMFVKDEKQYMTFDYVQLKWVTDEEDGIKVPQIINTNTKLRTFEVAPNCKFYFPKGANDPDEMDMENSTSGFDELSLYFDDGYYGNQFVYDVKIKNSKVMHCELNTDLAFGG